MNALKINLSDGDSVTIVPSADDQPAVLTIDDLTIQVTRRDDGFDIDFRKRLTKTSQGVLLGSPIIDVVSVTRSDIESNKAADPTSDILKTCITCNGRYYCMTGGCANTPCGWICG